MSEATIFAAALEKATEEERAAYLAEACAGDEPLRRRIEALLRAHAGSDAPLVTVDYAPISERPGTRIGPYRLMEQIGEGGFGRVFVAEQQEPVRRKVALKVIKPGMDSAQIIARFEAERQALALMDHPNIARVFDAGATESGRPYFVMELVRGIPITAYCDQHHLTPRERLELFVTVCNAIQHAHQKGIIHRDIKPANVLVTSHDGKPVAKVIDFGVAKAIHQHLTERTIYTNFAQMIGTPLYMSPEQAEMSGLDIDTRTDIYSLGVLLYELLTGTTPLEKKRLAKAAYDEIRRLIREDEPLRPSQRLSTSDTLPSIAANHKTEPAKLSRMMRGELDWIVMKALEKDRTRRYETANGLARDVQRYLADEAVEACPPSASYRLRKFARKNRAALTTAAAIGLLLLGGVGISTWQAVRAMRAEAVVAAARDAEAGQRQVAEANERKAVAAAAAETQAKQSAEAREAETKAVLDFVQDKIFAVTRPKGQRGGLGREVTLRTAVDAALPFVETNFKTQPLIEARLWLMLGESFFYLNGEAARAAELCEKARALYTKHLGSDHPQTLRSMGSLANCYFVFGQHADALKLREQTLAQQEAKLGRDHPDTLLSMDNLADYYFALGRHADALKLREQTLTRCQTKLGPDHPYTLGSMNDLAQSYRHAGRYAEARPLSAKYLESRLKNMPAEIPAHDWQRLRERGDLYARGGQWPKAAADFAAALKTCPEESEIDDLLYRGAPLWLQAGDKESYRRHCREMLRRFDATTDPILAERTAKACLLAPESDADLAPVLRLAERAVTGTERHVFYTYFQLARGLAHYRAGEFDRAIDRLNPCVTSTLYLMARVPAHLVQAMAHQRLGHAEEAGKALGKARALMAGNRFPHAEGGDFGDDWPDWLICQILYQEAETLIGTPK
jgi:eukaryotic-like serine/threonine-protein kinase